MKSSSKVLLVAVLSAAGLSGLALFPSKREDIAAAAPAAIPAVPEAAKPAVTVTGPEPVAIEGAKAFSDIGGLEKGATVALPLPGGGQKEGKLNYVNRYPNGANAAGGDLADGSGTFEIAREPWGYRGFVLQKKEGIAYVYSSDHAGDLQVARRPIGEVICEPDPNWKPLANAPAVDPENAAIYNNGRSVGIIYEAIPILSSLPRAEATIYLDFDGEIIEGHSWEGGRRIIATSYNLSAGEITDMWRRVSEDFAPFEVNVTTDLQAYLRAPQGRRIRCITTTNNFAAAGGVAFNGTFLESGDPCCWNFYSGNAGAVVISHEVGHTFGLHHDGRGTDGYFGGYGNGNMSWGPIMGAPYNQSICQWSKGEYPNANQGQDDIAVIGSSTPRRLDDHMPTAAQATPLTLGAGGAVTAGGLIDHREDLDAFNFTTGGGSLNLQLNPAPNSPNLDIEVKLYNAAGTLVATASPVNQLSATLSTAVGAGTYTLTVDGVGNGTWATEGYEDYDSLGEYSITGTVPSPAWRFRIAANALNGAVLGSVAPGTGSAFSITGGNTGTTFAIDASTGVIRVANAGGLVSTALFNLSVSYTASGSSLATSVPVAVAPLRGLKQEIWTGLGGNGIGPLTSLASYPNSPNVTRYSPIFQANYTADNYGQKMSGYLLPTETGNHTFWTTADDASEVWLSTDATPANKVRIAYNTANTGPDNWTQQGTQQSAPIALVAGQRYYIEVLHRDQTGPDHVGVYWQTPAIARCLIATQYLEYPGSIPNRAPWLANMTLRVREDSTATTVVGTLKAGDFEAGSTLSAFTITGGNTGNAFALNASTGVLRVNGALSFATLPKFFLNVQVSDSTGLTRSAQMAVEVEPRAVKREYWANVNGGAVTDLTSSPNYPNNPSSTSFQAFFETPANIAENYGQRLTGYLRAPDSGNFTFWISSDDGSQLFLSTDTNPANKVKIAYSDGATGSREWGKYPSQRSAQITLQAGKFYYVEVLHKEGAVDDNLAVAWEGPDFGRTILGAPHVTQNFYNHAAPLLESKTVTLIDRETAVTTLQSMDWSDPGVTITFAITGGNADGAFTINPVTGVITATGTGLPPGTRVLTVTASDNGTPVLSTSATLTVQIAKAGMKREVWTGLPDGQALGGLTGWLYYPQSPDLTGYTEHFRAPSGYGENYGQRLSGYLIPPVTGNYTFWIASDDEGELYLSSDGSPANKRRIANVFGSVNDMDWNAQGNQESVVIPLVAGQPYYIEAIQKEGGGGDHLAAAWEGPGFTQTLITGDYLLYPDDTRPALRREIWRNTNAVAWTNNPATGLMDWTTTRYAESFEGTGGLSGNATETGAGAWGASIGWARNNGVAAKAANGDALALLPFTPVAGKVYTLSLEIDPTNSPASTDWFSLGFLSQPATNTALYLQSSVFPTSGQSWMLVRANGNSGGTVQAFSAATAYGISASPVTSAIGTYDSIAVVLDTRNASWVSRYYYKGVQFGSHTLSPNPSIQSVGFSAFSTAKGNVRNFRIATNDAPAAGSRDFEGTLFSLKAPVDTEENFSQRLSGYIVPQATGDYTFWLATDDDGELLLSTDENPVNLAKIASVTGFVNPEAWDVNPAQKSVAKTLVAGKRYYVEVRHRDGIAGDHAAVAWQGPGIGRQVIGNRYLEHPSAPSDRSLLKREVWTGIGGDNVSDLTGLASYPASPQLSGTLAGTVGFVTGTDTADTFGERISGYIVVPDHGRYTFWLASDDGGELWLSTDENPSNRIKIASVSNSVSPQNWDSQASQKSAPIALEAGRRYYVEALHKEGIGGDHLAVAWQGPSFVRRVLPNQFLEHPLVIPGKPSFKREVWTGLGGTTVAGLTSSSAFLAGTPSARGVLTTFETPSAHGDSYGERISARLVVPESGNYKFWIASDESSELWLSTDTNPANRIKIAFTTAATASREWTKFATQESGSLALIAGQKYHIEALHKEGSATDHLAVAWQGPSFARQVIDGRFLEYPGNAPEAVALKREIWTGVGGNNVSDLTGLGSYPNSPNLILSVNDFGTPFNWGDNYGQKVSGYLIAPRSGDYTFWIASDDGGDLNFAANGLPASKTRIAYAAGATGKENWTQSATQTSAVISLVAGQRCYIEALQKEGGGDDYLDVAWQGPGFSRGVIRSQFLEYPGLPNAETQSGSPVPPSTLDPGFVFWRDYNGLLGNDRLGIADPDRDGIPNSLEFVIGGIPSGPNANSRALLPQITVDPVWATFVFRRADVALASAPYVQFGAILGGWTSAINGVGSVQITVQDDGFATGVDRVTVKVPRSGNRMFLRLNSNTP